MAVFTHFGPKSTASEISAEGLKHSYFAQWTPDKQGLVPGVLVQGKRPPGTNWVDVTTLSVDLPVRYFVQHTDFNTLVPGSLIQAEKRPEGRWKEVKKPTTQLFHRVVFSSGTYSVGTIASATTFTNNMEFVPNIMVPVLEEIWPGITANHVYAYMSYFKGSFAELGGDASKLSTFAYPYPGVYFRNFFNDGSGLYGSLMSTNLYSEIQMRVMPETPAGAYSFVLPVNRFEHGRYVTHYVVLENVFVKS